MSWDNRLFFGTHAVLKDGERHIHYKVNVLRPEKVTDQGDISDFTEALSEQVVIETPANCVEFHQSVFRNPNFSENRCFMVKLVVQAVMQAQTLQMKVFMRLD